MFYIDEPSKEKFDEDGIRTQEEGMEIVEALFPKEFLCNLGSK